MNVSNKLDQLTSLRFFAAFMIVIHHSVGHFGIESVGVNWGQGVSFFFVLSGFILAYVYPRITGVTGAWRFWRARFARIWPAYIATLLIGFALVPYAWDTQTAFANILMVQGWIPLSTFYFSYNAVAWSVSTEVFFYLAFPFLLYQWDRYWKLIFLASTVFLLCFLFAIKLLQLPDYGSPSTGSDGFLVTQHGLVYISPVARIFEFIFGMVIAKLWRTIRWSPSMPTATVLEIGAVVLCALSMIYANHLVHFAQLSPLGAPAALWLIHSSSFLAFGLLIFIMAHGRGLVSMLLSRPSLVVLGEISFSLYLLHQILLILYAKNATLLSWVPDSMGFLIYLVVLILSSYLLWVWVEMPGRRILLGTGTMHGTSTMKASWHHHAPGSRMALLAYIALVTTLGLVQLSVIVVNG